MKTITIIAIVVVALLTIIIFGLTWLAYSSCVKAYKLEIYHGKHDNEIYKEYHSNSKSKKGLAGLIGSYLVLFALLGLFIIGITYKIRDENLEINNKIVLVIKSNSMSDFFDDEISNKYNNDRSLQFEIGDICLFEKVNEKTNLVEGEIYGYKRKNIIITHRLVNYTNGLCEFRGDNNPFSDGLLIQRENVLYHYIGTKIVGIGSFILYAQSIFGIWSLCGIIGIAISSKIVYHKIDKINKERNNLILDKNMHDDELSKIDLINDKFGRAVAFVLETKDKSFDIEESTYERIVKEIWPQLRREKDEK